jgi:predicted anti-sigma-YlaC factor YlaD
MSNVAECLTYPDLLSCLDGTPGRCPQQYLEEHLYCCVKCRALFETMKEFIVDEPTPEELIVLDCLETGRRTLNMREFNPLNQRNPPLMN